MFIQRSCACHSACHRHVRSRPSCCCPVLWPASLGLCCRNTVFVLMSLPSQICHDACIAIIVIDVVELPGHAACYLSFIFSFSVLDVLWPPLCVRLTTSGDYLAAILLNSYFHGRVACYPLCLAHIRSVCPSVCTMGDECLHHCQVAAATCLQQLPHGRRRWLFLHTQGDRLRRLGTLVYRKPGVPHPPACQTMCLGCCFEHLVFGLSSLPHSLCPAAHRVKPFHFLPAVYWWHMLGTAEIIFPWCYLCEVCLCPMLLLHALSATRSLGHHCRLPTCMPVGGIGQPRLVPILVVQRAPPATAGLGPPPDCL